MVRSLRDAILYLSRPAHGGLLPRLVAWGRAGADHCRDVLDRMAGVTRNPHTAAATIPWSRVSHAGDRLASDAGPAGGNKAREPGLARGGDWSAGADRSRAHRTNDERPRTRLRLYGDDCQL